MAKYRIGDEIEFIGVWNPYNVLIGKIAEYVLRYDKNRIDYGVNYTHDEIKGFCFLEEWEIIGKVKNDI